MGHIGIAVLVFVITSIIAIALVVAVGSRQDKNK